MDFALPKGSSPHPERRAVTISSPFEELFTSSFKNLCPFLVMKGIEKILLELVAEPL